VQHGLLSNAVRQARRFINVSRKKDSAIMDP
jgi:hypothetical protein